MSTSRGGEGTPQARSTAYGLVFESTITIPEMRPTDDTSDPDVVITVADFPDALTDPLDKSPVHETDEHTLLLRVAGIARYLVRDGREILVDPDPKATAHEVRVYLLSSLGSMSPLAWWGLGPP